MILSDVINDPIEDIASGPTVLQSSADYITKCEQVVDKYKLKSTLPENFTEAMEKCKCEALSDSLRLFSNLFLCSKMFFNNFLLMIKS